MKVLHLSTNDLHGGAAKAAFRLHIKLVELGINSIMLVQNKQSTRKDVIGPSSKFTKIINLMRPTLDRLFLKFVKKKCRENRSLNILPSITLKKIREINPDIIHIHWVGGGFIPIEEIKKYNKPIIWTLHDMWPFSGAEHILSNEVCYKEGYFSKNCKSINNCFFDRFTWYRKKRSWKNLNIQFIAPSKWILSCVQNSFLKNNNNLLISHGVDINIFKPLDKTISRKILNLPQDKDILLFGAVHPNQEHKGFIFLKEALKYINKENILLCIFGLSSENYFEELNINYIDFGKLNDEYTLSILYSSASLLVVPSLQESFGLVAVEAQSCGTPVVAFDTTGLKDIVEHKISGYLATTSSSIELANGIKWVLSYENYSNLSENARKIVVNKFNQDTIIKEYINLYCEKI